MGIMVAASIVAIFVITKVVCWTCDREDDPPLDVEYWLERERRKNRKCELADAAEPRSGWWKNIKRTCMGARTCGA